jgi:3-phosphoinositide dependent protein kinase-1
MVRTLEFTIARTVTDPRSSLLLANENIIYTSSILVRPPNSINLPNFLMPSPKRRQLILTDFPRLFSVKEDTPGNLSVKSECVFVAHAHTRRGMSRGEVNARVEQGAAGWVLDVQDKGPKGFTVQTVSDVTRVFSVYS